LKLLLKERAFDKHNQKRERNSHCWHSVVEEQTKEAPQNSSDFFIWNYLEI
jgi:hypothetical protein